MIEFLYDVFLHQQLFHDFIQEMHSRLASIDWVTMFKVAGVLVVTMLLVSILIMINDRTFEASIKRRTKVHHLTIRNDGNAPSVYLLHTVDLPKTLAIRFRIKGNPMIWVSFDTGKSQEERQNNQQTRVPAETAQPAPAPTKSESSQAAGGGLVPNLNDPMKPVQTAAKAVSEVGKKAGFFASIFSTLSVLLPKTPDSMKQAQNTLKGVQQDSNSLVGQINTKTNAVNTLGDQLGKLPGADKVGGMVQSVGADPAAMAKETLMNNEQKSYMDAGSLRGNAEEAEGRFYLGKNFVYDEEVWRWNIGKEDDNGGALNYAQSRVLQPGESMKIDIEIINLSEDTGAISQLYKIEVVQVPQTNLHLNSVRRFLNGIVVFEKMSQLRRALPSLIGFVMILVTVQIIAGFTYLIF